MSVYNEILAWSQNKPDFIRDALRRIISSPSITEKDIEELTLLVKRGNGGNFVTIDPSPLSESDIPNYTACERSYPKLKEIKHPLNICALHEKSCLKFSTNGITIVYGNNGTGKSSYSRILKKFCWSRNPQIELKKNLFLSSSCPQQVDIAIDTQEGNVDFHWIENNEPHPTLRSIFVFDTKCGDIYVNNESPTEYKPIGVDILEKLIPVLSRVSEKLSQEIDAYTTSKISLEASFKTTKVAQWYEKIELLNQIEINEYLTISQDDTNKRINLYNTINNNNPQESITHLTNQKTRINYFLLQIKQIERLFEANRIQEIITIREDYEKIQAAHTIAADELREISTINGVGTNPWSILWDAAKKFAHSNGMSDGQNFPSLSSLEKCVLCQQPLDAEAKSRMTTFNKFVLNDISAQLKKAQENIESSIHAFNTLNIPSIETIPELSLYLTNIEEKYTEFIQTINYLKDSILKYLHNGGKLNAIKITLTPTLENAINIIDAQIEQQNLFLQNKKYFIDQYLELEAKFFLFTHKKNIARYLEEFKYKKWLSNCLSLINTTNISRKIGELISDQGVSLQHAEFIKHLNFFNPELATRVHLSKTKTTQGNTFQRCKLGGVSDSISSVLSEGEQKIVALSNFLAECTIDGRRNSIIIDDPVNSLDMNYRDLIANKFIEISKDRQLIVFTHDLAFLRMMIDNYKEKYQTDCELIGIDKYDGISGIVTDEIPFLAKNIQERVNSIRTILQDYDKCEISDHRGRETKIDSACKKFRMLLERTVEEILSNRTYERFSTKIRFNKSCLSSYIVVEKSDIDFLLSLYGKYSIPAHDGGTTTISQMPNKTAIMADLTNYSSWKKLFNDKLKNWSQENNYH